MTYIRIDSISRKKKNLRYRGKVKKKEKKNTNELIKIQYNRRSNVT